MKASVDRLVCVTGDEGEKNIMLTEYKARVTPERARREEDRIDELRMSGLMDEIVFFA